MAKASDRYRCPFHSGLWWVNRQLLLILHSQGPRWNTGIVLNIVPHHNYIAAFLWLIAKEQSKSPDNIILTLFIHIPGTSILWFQHLCGLRSIQSPVARIHNRLQYSKDRTMTQRCRNRHAFLFPECPLRYDRISGLLASWRWACDFLPVLYKKKKKRTQVPE